MKLGLIAVGFVVALGLSATACTSDGARSTNGPLAFAGEAPSDAPAVVFLRERPNALEPMRVMIEVVARGVGDLHGAAFRLTWDPESVGFVRAESGEKWSKTALALAKEGTPGQLVVAWTEKGEVGIEASGEAVLGTLVFESRGRKGTTFAFKTERSMLVDRKGVSVNVAWTGGSVAAH